MLIFKAVELEHNTLNLFLPFEIEPHEAKLQKYLCFVDGVLNMPTVSPAVR